MFNFKQLLPSARAELAEILGFMKGRARGKVLRQRVEEKVFAPNPNFYVTEDSKSTNWIGRKVNWISRSLNSQL